MIEFILTYLESINLDPKVTETGNISYLKTSWNHFYKPLDATSVAQNNTFNPDTETMMSLLPGIGHPSPSVWTTW